MALATYSDLQSAISSWLDGSSFSGREADFIALCEDEINARLAAAVGVGHVIRPMIDRDTLSITGEYVDLPDTNSDMILPLTIEVTGLDRPWQVKYIDPDSLVRLRFGQDEERDAIDIAVGSEPPRYYSIVGASLRFFPAPESTFTSQFTRFVKVPALSDNDTTNWVLTNHKNVYLYGTLAQAEMFGWNDKGMTNWAALFEQAVEGIISRYPAPSSNAPLRSELNMLGNRNGLTYNSFMAGSI